MKYLKNVFIFHLGLVVIVGILWCMSAFIAYDMSVWPPLNEWDGIFRFLLSVVYLYVWIIPAVEELKL